jgi:hypothetical protein
VRHHTSDEALDGIKADNAIRVGRVSIMTGQPCIHIELEPFGSTLPSVRGSYRPHTPAADLGIQEDGAFVEFDLPPDLPLLVVPRGRVGPRNMGEIITPVPLSLDGLNAVFVKVRRRFWQLWRTRAE